MLAKCLLLKSLACRAEVRQKRAEVIGLAFGMGIATVFAARIPME